MIQMVHLIMNQCWTIVPYALVKMWTDLYGLNQMVRDFDKILDSMPFSFF